MSVDRTPAPNHSVLPSVGNERTPLQQALDVRLEAMRAFVEEAGRITLLTRQTLGTALRTRFEWRAFVDQLEQLGVRSLGIAAATAVFVGIVMTVQFAITLEKYGAKDTIGRIVGLSETRELAPTLTALVVGSRVAAGMAAELGSMAVTEQIDAIRALGADPIRKLVVPRLAAAIVAMPLLTCFCLLLGIGSAMVVSFLSYGVPLAFFWQSAMEIVTMQDFVSGIGKTPFFGFFIGILGCYFGLETRGGTAGVGQSTTRAVVVVSITVLVADAVLTKLFLAV